MTWFVKHVKSGSQLENMTVEAKIRGGEVHIKYLTNSFFFGRGARFQGSVANSLVKIGLSSKMR